MVYLFVFVKRQPAFPLRSASRRVSSLPSFTSFASLTSSNSLSSSCHRHVTKNPSQQPLQNQQLQTVTPATPLESAFTKTAGCLHQRFPFWNSPPRHTNLSRALSFHALTWNPFCNPFVLIFIHVMGGYPLPNLPTFKPSNVPTFQRVPEPFLPSHQSPVTLLSEPLPVRKECIERTIGSAGPSRQTFLRPEFRCFRLRRRVRWVSSLGVGSSSSRASPFFVPTNN